MKVFTWKKAMVSGFLVLLVALSIAGMFPQAGAGYEPGYGQPVFAFEMAKTKRDLRLVFGAQDDPKRPERIKAMDRGNRWDYLFMVVYGAFLWLFFAAAANQRNQMGWMWFGWLAVASAFADAVENVILLGITADLQAAQHIEWLMIPVWAKFFLLMIAGLGAAAYMITTRSIGWKLCGVIVGIGALAVFRGWLAPASYGQYVGLGVGIGWFAMLVYATIATLRGDART